MNSYMMVSVLKVRTTSGIRELEPGEVVTLPEHLAEPLLRTGRIRPMPLPTLDVQGELERIPFGCHPRFWWWDGGQLPSVTEREVRGWLH